MNPRYPLYIPSKGRYESRVTHRALVKMGVPHRLVVEPSEFARYAEVIPASMLLELDLSYKERYEVCDEFGLSKSPGSGPARNFIWDHAVASGASWHWIMDDNIDGFFRLNHNLKTPVATGAIFRAMEDFVERYENVAMAGPNYFMFASRKSQMPAFRTNTRIYSCNLIRNDLPFRWRARYNEDTDLSLRILKAGWCTVLFSAFLQRKMTTQTLPGGNTTELYGEGTRAKSEMLARLHPDVARVVERYGRIHHEVDYSYFDTRLKRKPGVEIPPGVDNYGMVLQQEIDGEWRRIDKPRGVKRSKYAEDAPR